MDERYSDRCIEEGCRVKVLHISGRCPDHRPSKLYKCTYTQGDSDVCNKLVHEKTRRHQRVYCDECNAKFIARKAELNERFRLRSPG